MRADDHAAAAHSSGDHLSDDQLVEICFAAAESSHLTACQVCRSRYDGLTQVLDALREDAQREADAVFTAERLGEQRDRILRRLERSRQVAEVLVFPGRAAGQHARRRTPGLATRWIAAAAVAGLVAGLFLGRFMNPELRSLYSARSRAVPAAPRVVAWPDPKGSQPADEELLGQIEDALNSRRVLELRALDALTTPELREVSFDAR